MRPNSISAYAGQRQRVIRLLGRFFSFPHKGLIVSVLVYAGFVVAAATIVPQSPSHASEPPDLDDLVRRHKATRDGVHELRMRIAMYPAGKFVQVANRRDAELRSYRHYLWYRKGRKERLVVRPLTAADLSRVEFAREVQLPDVRRRPTWYSEYLLDWGKGKMGQLEIPQRENLGRLSRECQFGLQAMISPIQRRTLKWTPHHVFLLRFMLNAFDASRTLEDLITECQGRYAGEAVVDGHACHKLSFVHPGSGGIDKGVRFDVFLDPAKGCLARQLEMHRPEAEGGTWRCTITEFQDLGNGLYMPIAARWWSGDDSHTYVLRAIDAQVNRGIVNPSDVILVFPKSARVLVLASPPSPLRAPAIKEVRWIGAGGVIEKKRKPREGKQADEGGK